MIGGAIDFEECPLHRKRGLCRCLPKCKVCGYGKHTAIHGPRCGEQPGSEPWGHEFEPEDERGSTVQ